MRTILRINLPKCNIDEYELKWLVTNSLKQVFRTFVHDVQIKNIGWDLFRSLWLSVVQKPSKRGKSVKVILISTSKYNQAIVLRFAELVSRIGLSKTHINKS